MDYLHLISRNGVEQDLDANFGVDLPRKGDWLEVPPERKRCSCEREYIVVKVLRRLREIGAGETPSQLVQYDRHVTAEEI